ncbi:MULTISPECIES: glycoside hydrolase family 3 N-terminal domain-containing protein [Corynebacterium]|jgi:beta-N-acetylglucosaminidase family protein|uniref:glycoside hydrolase family 3 N-terminal domain-containing protein n=1 Tax=Corynebacterium TaxID=1716 RepID=UPI00041E51FA|nr:MULTISPECIES: glycoside hydrolase family 3 N-terminal domain-containing protein [Corynebacterium]MDK4209505.1 glycoside hydrolase family 3 N-terminal domain-containing protein [Corynebacterium accolens]
MTYSRIIVSLGLVAVLSACSNSASDEDKARESAAPAPSSPGSAASATEAAPAPAPAPVPEDIRATAASVLMPPATSYEDAKAKLEAGVGGIFIPSWADPGLLEEEGRNINALRAELGRDFEVAIDFEGGRVQRFSEILGEYPSAQQMAADHSPEQVEQLAGDIGKRLMDYGINVDFAPVLDVDGDGLEVVGDRAFSTDPVQAGDYGAAFARGLDAAGVKAVFKHFPGHGRASGDTHLAEAITPPLEELENHEFIPFRNAIPAAPNAALMMGHLAVPGLGDGQTPASILPEAYGLAREALQYDGTIYTDDIGGMAAISDSLPLADAVITSLAAGADMPLWSTEEDINAVIDAVVGAVDEGRLAPERLGEAARHVHDGDSD